MRDYFLPTRRAIMRGYDKIDLSIVIVCKNEERFIGKCIESVIKATKGIENKEILVVDSSSTDDTIHVAKQYPVTIVQLRAKWRHTPAAGKYVGFRKSSGDYIFFLDGDSFLVDGFIEKSLECFNGNIGVAAIIGRRKEIYYDKGKPIGERRDMNEIGEVPRLVVAAIASAIYRRAALEKVGCFNPYLFSEEEAELSDRLKRAGYKIMGLPYDMVVHNTLPRERVKTLFQRMKSNFHLGPGQIMRYGLRKGISGELFRKISSGLQFLGWLMIGSVSAVISVICGSGTFILVWMGLSVLLFIIFAVKSRNILKPVRYSLIWSVQSYSIIRGFLLKPMAPETYPMDVIVIKQS
jgi:glycosyltransferase involved in cell wall biosynthesis